ncbi:hypothetical protein Tco_0882100, partial [Tanacetum coccineum]
PQSQNVEEENKPAIVLDETCENQQDYYTSLMGKVKEFSSLTNLKVVLANKDEELHDENAGMHNHATVKGESDVEEVSETIFENEQYQAHKKDDLNIRHNDIRSEDPFNIYDLLNKKHDNIIRGSSSDNMKYAPGFTPTVATEVQSNDFKKLEMEGDECLQNIHDDKVASKVKKTCHLSNSKNDTEESIFSGHLKKAELPRSGGYKKG